MSKVTPEQREQLVKGFSVALSSWLNEFEDLPVWVDDEDISAEKWAEFRRAVNLLLDRHEKMVRERFIQSD